MDLTSPQATPLFGIPTDQTELPSTAPIPKRDDAPRFGVGKDILGFLGDFLLTKLGMPAQYGPGKQRKKLAWASSTEDPTLRQSRIAEVDPILATKLREQEIDNARLNAAQASTAESRASREAASKALELERHRNILGNFIDGLASRTPEEAKQTYEQMYPRFASSYPEAIADLPSEFDPALLDAYADSRVPGGMQRSQRLQKETSALVNEDRDTSFAERQRHNRKTESQGDARIGIAEARAASVAERRSTKSSRSGDGRRPSNVMTYIGEDGYKYAERSDGTVVKSKGKVRAGSGGKPSEGTRRVITSGPYKGRTAVIKGGKPVLE